mmetsp:Transcript_2906/g.4351  ORF Transcript_2906/g.4351 Transcript_2906/m.4351 type:complete len:355 (+) Transcript_2906:111-1175(+)
MSTFKPKVLITGVSGYIGSYVCKTFLEHGGFNVRGTVRDKSSESKIAPLRIGYGDELFARLELVNADLMNEDSIMAAAEGCDYIVHTASPVCDIGKVFENEDEIIKPAVDGTLAIMKAARKNKAKKVVITSSIAAVAGDTSDKVFTEEDWTDITKEGLATYHKSKTLAEKAAWDFVAELPNDEKIPLVTINPGIVLGPNVSTGSSESLDFCKNLMLGKWPMYPSQKVGFVDVRDVSKAHLEGLLRDEANDKRFILCAESPELVEFVRPLEAKFGKDYPVRAKEMPKFMPMVMRLWNPEMAELYKAWGKGVLCDGSRAAEILGIEYIGLEKCMVEMADSMISTGCIEDKRTTKAA